MKPLRIEFGDSPPAIPAWAVLLFVCALAWCAHGLWRISWAQAELGEVRRLAAERTELRLLVSAPQPPPSASGPEVTPERARSVAGAVDRLNTNWSDLFTAVGKGKPDAVALLAIEPDLGKGVVKITAETRDAAEMLNFAERLAKQGGGTSASLAKHETSDRDPLKPYRFQIEAQWRRSQ